MHYTIIGGDARSVYLAELILSDGHEVSCLALDNAVLPNGAVHTDAVETGAVILPLPAERGEGGILNAPFAAHELKAVLTAEMIPEGCTVFGGRLSPTLRTALERRSLAVTDIMSCPGFTVGNAAICAEGAVSLLSTKSDRTLYGSRVLVVGFGRIGRLTAQKLHALGCEVSVMSRSEESRAMAEAFGVSSVKPDIGEELSLFDAVVNTAPAPLIKHPGLLRRDCTVIELASAPGLVPQEHERFIAAPGLPGKYAPQSAARLIYDVIKESIE